MWILVRADLPPSLQITHAACAAFKMAYHEPLTCNVWQSAGNSPLKILQVPDERTLRYFYERLMISDARNKFVIVTEPDLNFQHTALACSSGPGPAKLFSNLPLALQDPPQEPT